MNICFYFNTERNKKLKSIPEVYYMSIPKETINLILLYSSFLFAIVAKYFYKK